METQTRELTAEEIAAVNGALAIDLYLPFVHLYGTVTKDGVSGGVKVGDGPWHGGSIFFDDLPK